MPYDEKGLYYVSDRGRKYPSKYIPPNCCICGADGVVATPTGAFLCIAHSNKATKEVIEIALDKQMLLGQLSDIVESINKELECPLCKQFPLLEGHAQDCPVTTSRELIKEMQQ